MAVISTWTNGTTVSATDLTDTFASKTTTAMATNAQTGSGASAYAFVLTDAGKTVTANNAAVGTYNIPLEASVPWVANTELRVWNIGAGTVTVTCTSGTLAGTVTIPQYGFVTFKKLGTNTWYGKAEDTAVSSGGLVLINATTFSAVSSVSVNNCFTSTYTNYLLILDNMVCSGAVAVNIRMRASGSDNTSANYSYGQIAWAGGSLAGYGQSGQTSSTFAVGNPSVVASATVQITNPQTANPTSGTSSAARSPASSENFLYSFGHNVASAFDGFTIFPASGSFGGTIRVYGYKNS